MKKPSPTMQRAMAYAIKHNGKLHRHPGGFWGGPLGPQADGVYFGTNTVAALVSQGFAEWTMTAEAHGSEFPTEATLTDKGHVPFKPAALAMLLMVGMALQGCSHLVRDDGSFILTEWSTQARHHCCCHTQGDGHE